jgi:hypothetical protein
MFRQCVRCHAAQTSAKKELEFFEKRKIENRKSKNREKAKRKEQKVFREIFETGKNGSQK